MTSPNYAAKVREFLTSKGIQATDAEFQDMTETLRKSYEDSVAASKATSEQPRSSTKPSILQDGRDANTVTNEAAQNNLAIQRGTADIAGGMRDRRIDGDIRKNDALTDAHTNSQLALMGGTFRDLQGDTLASKDRTVQGSLDYYSGRDDKYVDIMKGEQALAGRGMNMDFIGKLVAGAALMAG